MLRVIVAVFDFDPTTSGHIEYVGGTYTPYVGATDCRVYRRVVAATSEKRAFFQFDTSSIPTAATVTRVEFYQKLAPSQPQGIPDNTVIRYDIGAIIGTALNGTVAEWSGLTAATTILYRATEIDGEWIDLAADGDDPTSWIAKDGKTDLRIVDESVRGTSADPSWGTDLNGVKPGELCRLRVTYTAEMGEVPVCDEVIKTLRAHTGSGQALEGIVIGDSADIGVLPRIDVQCESFTMDENIILGVPRKWIGRVGVLVTLRVSTISPWRRVLTEILGAVRSILADEYASSITGIWRVLSAGGNPLTADGTAALRFDALLFGTYTS